MSHQDEYLSVLNESLRNVACDQAELSVEELNSDVTKFNEGGIFQNISEKRMQVKARVIKNGRMSCATCQGDLAKAADKALAMACDIVGFGEKIDKSYSFPGTSVLPEVDSFDQKTADYSCLQRAEDLKAAVDGVGHKGLDISGSLKLEVCKQAVVNSSGLSNFASSSRLNMNFIAQTQDSQSHSGMACVKVEDLDLKYLAAKAAERCLKAQNPKTAEPGLYSLVLPPNALADLTPFFGMLIFSGLADLENRCFISGKLGQKVASDLVSLRDDSQSTVGLPLAMDIEGVPKKTVQLIDKGKACGFVHDSLTAFEKGVESTGHAFPATPAVYGPLTANLVMEPGTKSLEQMIAGVERGIFATRLHYVRCLNDKAAQVGGVTSNGTFLIENGKVVGPVQPMRFDIRLVDEMLANISAVGKDQKTVIRTAQGPTSVSLFSSAHTMPAVVSDNWRLRETN